MPVHTILPNLYLGSFDAAQTAYREEYPNAYVINATKDLAFFAPPEDANHTMRIAVDDNGTVESALGMLLALPAACDAIALALNASPPRPVIVHCFAGQQRSPTVIAAYLMRSRRWSAEEAVRFVRSRKPDAFFWCVNFKQTLDLWARQAY